MLITGASTCAFSQTEDLAAAVANGKVSVTFQGLGGSSGDTIQADIRATSKAGGDLELTVAPGTRLQCGNSSAQNMVIAEVKGRLVGGNAYAPTGVIRASTTPTTYVFEAYCTDFEKNNPASEAPFTLGKVDPALAFILNKSGSTIAKQAAVWIYTDHASFDHVNQKFPVSQGEWEAAKAIVRECVKSSRSD